MLGENLFGDHILSVQNGFDLMINDLCCYLTAAAVRVELSQPPFSKGPEAEDLKP
jgi:hypothetical protein